MRNRSVTLFTGQWADLPLESLLPLVREMGYDGVELACWGDHFDVREAIENPAYAREKWQLLLDHGLTCHSISNHLVGQAVCDRVDGRHQAILPAHVWGDGDPTRVRERAAREMGDTAKACRLFLDAAPPGARTIEWPAVVNGFTGSPIWHALYAFPPTDQSYIDRGFAEFADCWRPVLEEFDTHNVHFALEVHPTEIAFDIATAARALDALDHHSRFGFNYDPSHLGYQGVNYVLFIRRFAKRIFHVHMKDAWWGRGDGQIGVFGGHTDFGHPSRYWDFRSLGHGDIDFEEIIVALNDIGYRGPLSVEWEDSRMDRLHGAREACAFTRSVDFPPSTSAFDAAFDRESHNTEATP